MEGNGSFKNNLAGPSDWPSRNIFAPIGAQDFPNASFIIGIANFCIVFYILLFETGNMSSASGVNFVRYLFYAGNTISKQRKQALVALAYATARDQMLTPKAILIRYAYLT